MKPVTTITQKESAGSITNSDLMQAEIQQLSHISNGKQWKWRTRFLVGLVVLVIILAAVIVGAVFLGQQLSKESIQTFQATYKTDSKGNVRENIIVSATEVKFQIPGVADAVLDFDKGLSMYKRRDEDKSLCFLTTFNASEGMAPKELKDYLEKTQGTNEAEREIHNCYKATNVSITNRNFLSPITKNMCNNVEIFWMIKDDLLQQSNHPRSPPEKDIYYIRVSGDTLKQLVSEIFHINKQPVSDCSNLRLGRQKRASVSLSLFWGVIKVTVSW